MPVTTLVLTQRGDRTMLARLGYVLHWVCLALGMGWMALFANQMQGKSFTDPIFLVAVVPAGLFVLLGWALRYILAGD